MSNLRPNIVVGSVTQLNPEVLIEKHPGVIGIAFDMDKTLTGQHDLTIPDAHLETLQALSEANYELGIISNARDVARTGRVRQIADYASKAIGRELHVVTSVELHGVSKPATLPFTTMSRKMRLDPSQTGYVGDQLFKDILGANRSNYGLSILVTPFGEGDNPGVKYLQRPVESLARVGLGLPFRTKNFGK